MPTLRLTWPSRNAATAPWPETSSKDSLSSSRHASTSSSRMVSSEIYSLCSELVLLTFNRFVGEAAGGTNSLKKDLVLYDGAKSHITQYNFCYLCKERLDTYHDDADENWYFLDTKQVRFKSSSAAAVKPGDP